MKDMATAYLVFYLDDQSPHPNVWAIGCLADEPEENLRNHLEKIRPGARWVGAIIVPDSIYNSDKQ